MMIFCYVTIGRGQVKRIIVTLYYDNLTDENGYRSLRLNKNNEDIIFHESFVWNHPNIY